MQKFSHPNQAPRAYLGINGETDAKRVRIRSVHRRSPAELAGWQAEDVLLEFAGQPVESFDQVLKILTDHQAGEEIAAKLNRFGQLIELPVRLESK